MKLKTKYFDLDYEAAAVRSIKSGNTEIIRMIFSAVRDQNWGTVPPKILTEEVAHFKDGFTIKTEVEYAQDNIKYNAFHIIRGEHNRLSFEMRGKALHSFKKNRIGICVLHPIKECAGKSGKIILTDNSIESFTFPKQIAPHQPVKNIKLLNWKPDDGIDAQLNFEGEVFEMEDQRNWTDASFKTYCTPLELPFPVEVKKGEEICQKVILNVDVKSPAEPENEAFFFTWNKNQEIKLPQIGFGVSSRIKKISKKEISLLKKIKPHHLRADIHLEKRGWQNEIKKAITEASHLNAPLFLCLYFPGNYQSVLEDFLKYFENKQNWLTAILPVGLNHLPHPTFDKIAKEIRSRLHQVKVGTGVNAYFAELNRNRPEASNADFICFSACPQVHAFDEKSIVENLEGLAEVVKSTKQLFPNKPVWISPVTLKQRFNLVATEEENYSGLEELAPQVDPRQPTSFAANWTLGAIKQLAQSGADVVDFYETVGLRGIVNANQTKTALPEFRRNIFPLLKLFRVLSDVDTSYPSVSSHPQIIDGLVFPNGDSTKLVIANFTEKEKIVAIPRKKKNGSNCSFKMYPNSSEKLPEKLNKIRIYSNKILILSM